MFCPANHTPNWVPRLFGDLRVHRQSELTMTEKVAVCAMDPSKLQALGEPHPCRAVARDRVTEQMP